MKSLKHLHSYTSYLNEQEMDPMGGDPATTAPPKQQDYRFIFIKKGELGDYQYPDGSSSSNFTTYKLSQSELNDWVGKNVISPKDKDIPSSVLDIKKKALIEYIAGLKDGISPDSKDYVESFRKACVGNQIGVNQHATEVVFSPGDNIPTTDILDVTFILV